jgi:hypothetical protein
MIEQHEPTITTTDGVAAHEPTDVSVGSPEGADHLPEAAPPESETRDGADGVAEADWHAEAGRKGAHRVHQLIQEGRLYEQEHGLTSGRQRLRQLIELGKLYEQEHGLRPGRRKTHGQRLARVQREELLDTFVQCLVRIARPSFRAKLERLVEALREEQNGHAA